MKTSIRYSKLWVSPIAADGSIGSNWIPVQTGAREGTAQFNGSDADTTIYKNIVGNALDQSFSKGTKTVVFQGADLSPETISLFTGGTVTTTTDYVRWEAPADENTIIELSVKILTGNGIVFYIPRVQFDSYPTINDDDLHYFTVNGTVLQPTDTASKIFWSDTLTETGLVKNDITAFAFEGMSGSATIDDGAKTVTATLGTATITAIAPVIEVSPGADITPNSGVELDFSSPVEYVVESASGATETWTVTISA